MENCPGWCSSSLAKLVNIIPVLLAFRGLYYCYFQGVSVIADYTSNFIRVDDGLWWLYILYIYTVCNFHEDSKPTNTSDNPPRHPVGLRRLITILDHLTVRPGRSESRLAFFAASGGVGFCREIPWGLDWHGSWRVLEVHQPIVHHLMCSVVIFF